MRVFQSRDFQRFARRSGLEEVQLCKALMDMEAGQVDADLGGHVYKQRVSRRGAGKSGGFRVILLLRWESHCIFVHGYAKSDKSSLSFREVAVYRLLATRLLKMEELVKLIENGKVSEVHCNGETISD